MTAQQDIENYESAKAEYHANADYRASNSPAKARLFSAACTRLIGIDYAAITFGGAGGESRRPDIATLQRERDAADRYGRSAGHQPITITAPCDVYR